MINPFLISNLQVTRIRQRAVPDGTGFVVVRRKDGSHVRISVAEWDEVGTWFREAIRPSARALNISTLLAIPMAVAFLAVAWSIPPLGWLVRNFIDFFPLLAIPLLFGGFPLTMMVRHVNAVARARARIDTVLAECTRSHAPVPQVARKALNGLEIIALFVVGPHLLFGIVGSMNPNIFRNTPLSGTHIDAQALIGFAVLAGIVLLRFRFRSQMRLSVASPTDLKEARHVDALARARNESV